MWKISFFNPSTSEPVYRGQQGPRRGLMRRERISAPKNLLNAQNTEKLVSANRADEILISTSSEKADEATKLQKLPIIPRI